jgi:UDP-N-acetylglucosamine 2-epimerase
MYAVLTIHRVENTDDAGRLARIMEAVAGSGLEIIYPCHPRTRARLEATGLLGSLSSSGREGSVSRFPIRDA